MKQIKTTGILQSLDILDKIENGREEFSRELIDLDKTKKKEYVKFWQYIDSCGHKFEESEADKRFAFQAAFGVSSKFSIRKANAMLRQLVDWIDEFAIDKEVEQSGYRDLVRAKYFHSKGEKEKSTDALNLVLEKALNSDEFTRLNILPQAYRNQYFFAENRRDRPELLEILRKIKSTAQGFAHTSVFKATIEELNYLRARGEEIPRETIQIVELQFALLPEKPITLISLQVLVIKLYLAPSVETYTEFKSTFMNEVDKLNSDKDFFLTFMVNALVVFPFLSKNITEEQLDIYKFGMNKRIFISEGKITMTRFNNIVFLFKSLGRFELISEFINAHENLIADKLERKNSVLLAKCQVLFGEGRYLTALADLENVQGIHYTISLWKYILKIKCHYERDSIKNDNSFDILEIGANYKRMVDKYYGKKKYKIGTKRSYYNFYKIVALLLDVRHSKREKEKILSLMDDIGNKLVEIKWIKEKVNEILTST